MPISKIRHKIISPRIINGRNETSGENPATKREQIKFTCQPGRSRPAMRLYNYRSMALQ